MLLVFDLDFTIWDCGGTWCDCTSPPFRNEGGKVLDSSNRHIRLYPDVLPILKAASDYGCKLAAASRTHEPEWAEELLRRLGIDSCFDWKEIYPGPKIPHFKALKKKSGLEFSRMYFFDDEMRNIQDIRSLGVNTVHVRDGLEFSHLEGILSLVE